MFSEVYRLCIREYWNPQVPGLQIRRAYYNFFVFQTKEKREADDTHTQREIHTERNSWQTSMCYCFYYHCWAAQSYVQRYIQTHTGKWYTLSTSLFNLKVHLKEPDNQFRFLSVLWTYNYNLSNQLNFAMDAVLQTRALYIGHAMLISQTMQMKKQLASEASPGTIHWLPSFPRQDLWVW